ncbi:MAG: hypothetical protein Q8R28_23405 [Dehalococcoidia bacterium]|nr:hypothetical protein [Dehalococcoidia bacterium]
MRKLLYVPVIHTQSDMGSLGLAIDEVSATVVGNNRWARHKETVTSFWDVIEGSLTSIEVGPLKVYQDGLAAGGELGRKVVEEAARRGSKNHRIVLDLMEKGAEIRQTEELSLLLEEARLLLQMTQGGSKAQDARKYERQKQVLTQRRDKSVADSINRTLKEGETGVLFMGAYHNILPLLDQDIEVTAIKDRERVEAYFQELLSGHDEDKLARMASYLVS